MNTSRIFAVSLLTAGMLFAGCRGAGSSGPTVKSASNTWFMAASSGSKADLDAALKSGDSINAHESSDRNTPLHVAAMAGNVEAVRFMLANGANADALDEDGRTALMMALHNNQQPAATALIEGGANLEIRDREGKTALMFAGAKGHANAVDAMVKKGVSVDAQNRNGSTALMFAAENGHVEAARSLKAAGASTTLRNRRGHSAMDYARKRSPEMEQVLKAE